MHFQSSERQDLPNCQLPNNTDTLASHSRHILSKRTRIEQSPANELEECNKRQKIDEIGKWKCYSNAMPLIGKQNYAGMIKNDNKEILLRMFEQRMMLQKGKL